MAALCENAFAYGAGYLVPIVRENGVRYWTPDPLWTVLVTDPMDVCRVVGLIQMVRDERNTQTIGLRFVAPEIEGEILKEGTVRMVEHRLPFAPVVVAYGRDRRHQGKRYGKSLILPAADGSIQVTNNELNLELLRDRQTQALLLLFGTPDNTQTDSGESMQKYLLWSKTGEGDAKYITPESRLEQVIRVTERQCTDITISTGLPLDTFRPELVAGADASATAARWRAFPLQQRMVRMVLDWEQTEEDAIAVIAALCEPGLAGGQGPEAGGQHVDLEEIAEAVGAQVNIMPSLPEAEAETLAGWQQRTEKFFAPIEDAIEFYSGHLSDAEKKALADKWRAKHEPGARTTEIEWKREIVKALFGDPTTGDVLANLTNLRTLLDEVGVKRQEGYEEPWLPVVAATGPLVSGETVEDEEGDVVGGDVMATKSTENTEDGGQGPVAGNRESGIGNGGSGNGEEKEGQKQGRQGAETPRTEGGETDGEADRVARAGA